MTLLLALLLAAPPPPAAKPPAAPFATVAAEAAAAREADRIDDALRLYRRAVTVKPGWQEGWWYLGTLYYGKDQYPQCRDAFRRFVAIEARMSPAWAMLGLCEFQTKEFARALERLEKATTLGLPEGEQLTGVAQYHHALLLTKAGNFERALLILTLIARKSTAASPEVVALAGIASLRKPIFPHELAEGDRELALRLGRAVITAAERKQAEARRQFEEVLADYPAAPHVHYLFGAFLLSSEPDRGIAELRKEIEISPDHLPALVSLSMEYLKRGEPASARPFAERAAKQSPGNFAARTAFGRALIESGDLSPGIAELEAAVKLAPDSPQVRIALASAYAKAGRKEEAARERAEFARLRKLLDSAESQK
ncbi:MAG: tetratricopeptide repeat protein [Bryobacteraceae bacterium]|nr:tetratricopeptide repeat protein [Bryobacteraceae bacterium]